MKIVKPSISGAISSITKGIKQLEAVIAASEKDIEKARDAVELATADRELAVVTKDRANRIKAKLEELVA